MAAKIGVRGAMGVDELVLSDFLQEIKAGLTEELHVVALDEEALTRILVGEEDAPSDVQRMTWSSYNALGDFMKKEEAQRRKKARDGDGYIDFRDKMERVDDGKGGLVWVRKENVQRWKDILLANAPST